MSELCELCGARWEPGATTCRECGAAPQPPMPALHDARPAAPSPALVAPPSLDASPEAVTPAVSAPVPSASRGRLWLALAGGLLALGGVALAIGLRPSDGGSADAGADAASSCAELEALAGPWVFTTVTTGARQRKRVGGRAFYELSVRVDARDCTARAELVNVGRSGALVYEDDRVQRASGSLARGEGARAFGYGAVLEPRNAAGQGIPKRFTFTVDGDRLVGTWRQRGEHWLDAGKFGVLEGRRTGDPRELEPRRRAMPCRVQCAAPKTIEEADAEPDAAALEACLAACE